MKTNNPKVVPAFSICLTFFLFFINGILNAKTLSSTVDCGCTVTLKPIADGGIYSNGSTIAPGSKVCIASGTYKYINLSNYHGTAQSPIQIINCGGQVNVTGLNYAFSITNSSFFSFTGTGAAGVTYGFKSTGGASYTATGMGLGSSSDFNIDHLDISKTTVGVMCKTNPTCDPSTWQAALTMKNLSFHDIYVHDVLGEGFYVGHTSSVVKLTCNGIATDVLPQKINGLKIYKCLVDSTGWDGIQVASAPVDAQVYQNTVLHFGTKNQSSQQAGILFGGMSNGKVYNNYVNNGTGNGIQVFGVGYIQIYNNLVVNVGGNNVISVSKDGIFMDDRPIAGYPAPYYTVCNNTVVSPKRSGIRLENTFKTVTSMSEYHNNFVVASGEPDPDFTSVVIRNNAPNHSTGNLYISTTSSAKFKSTTDYHLGSSSPAVDEGVVVSSWGITTDKDGLNRLMGVRPDAGAYEYSSTAGAVINNLVPVALAGANQTVTLPTNSITLAGDGTDADGTVTKYAWSQISGPSQIVIANGVTPNPKISNLIEGTYTVRLTVTDSKNAVASDDMLITVKSVSSTPPSSAIVVPARIEAENYVTMSGIKTEATKDIGGGSDISWVHNNDWMDYNIDVKSSGTYTVNFRIACYVNTGQIQLRKGSTVLSTLNVPNTGGYQTWQTVSTTVALQAGVQTLRVYSSNTGAWFLNWFELLNGSTLSLNRNLQIGSITTPEKSALTKSTFGIFPNPIVSTSFTLKLSSSAIGLMKVQIIDIFGNIIKELRLSKNQWQTQLTIPANQMPSGAYSIKVQVGDWKTSQTIVKL